MVAEKGTQTKTQQQREQHFELLNSTQIVISEALEKLGYPNEVYELLKRTSSYDDSENTSSYG